MRLKKSVFLAVLFLALIGFGCSSSDSDNNKGGDKDITETVDNQDASAETEEGTVADGDEESGFVENEEETMPEGEISQEEQPQEEEQTQPCGGSCEEGTICHEEVNGGTCLPNCNEGDGELIGDEYCHSLEISFGFNPYDYMCRPDGQCVLNDFGRSCKQKAEQPADNALIDCSIMCDKINQCSQWEFCEFNCNIGTHEFRDEFAEALEQCFEQTENCGPPDYNGAVEQYCFEQALQQVGIPQYVSEGCNQLQTFLTDTCQIPQEDVERMIGNCSVMGAALKRDLFDQLVSCASGFCEDFEMCMAQSNCLFTRQY